MKFGIFLLLQSPDMRPSQETYEHALEQGVLADQLGFDYIVAAEHHFSSYGFLPCPLLLIPTLPSVPRRSVSALLWWCCPCATPSS
jgi:alkanesulfonate monooxygenase SsuD/methylene tetrahydromethanopterin reductase-like flavin-dependent oxidoreductase (luciferase family)